MKKQKWKNKEKYIITKEHKKKIKKKRKKIKIKKMYVINLMF